MSQVPLTSKDVVVGVDVGTTTTSIGGSVGGAITIYENPNGHSITPSMLAIRHNAKQAAYQILTGEAARACSRDALSTCCSVKNVIGCHKDDPAMQRVDHNIFFQTELEEERHVVKLLITSRDAPEEKTTSVTPEVISALYIRNALEDARKKHPNTKHIVLTCPAYFGDERRASTMAAALLAGAEPVCDVVDEPIAAAVYFSHKIANQLSADNPLQQLAKPLKILVFDLGGGDL